MPVDWPSRRKWSAESRLWRRPELNDAFAWDIGDLAKFVVLRNVVPGAIDADHLRLGAVWCRTRVAPTAGHGEFVSFLREGDAYGQLFRTRDPQLYELMRAGLRTGRSIDSPEYRRLLPDDTAHVTEWFGSSPTERREYWDVALERTAGADVVFFDPDNAIVSELPRSGRQLRSPTRNSSRSFSAARV